MLNLFARPVSSIGTMKRLNVHHDFVTWKLNDLKTSRSFKFIHVPCCSRFHSRCIIHIIIYYGCTQSFSADFESHFHKTVHNRQVVVLYVLYPKLWVKYNQRLGHVCETSYSLLVPPCTKVHWEQASLSTLRTSQQTLKTHVQVCYAVPNCVYFDM